MFTGRKVERRSSQLGQTGTPHDVQGWKLYYYYLNYLVRKQSARCPGTFRTQARPAPARALTPRPRWKLTRPSPVPPDTVHQPNSEPTAAEPTQAIPNRRSTFLARREPLLVSPVGVAFPF